MGLQCLFICFLICLCFMFVRLLRPGHLRCPAGVEGGFQGAACSSWPYEVQWRSQARILDGSAPPIEIAEEPLLLEAAVAKFRTPWTTFQFMQKPCNPMVNTEGRPFTCVGKD